MVDEAGPCESVFTASVCRMRMRMRMRMKMRMRD